MSLDFFQRGIRFLNTLPEFKNMTITGKVMRTLKKDHYYSTVTFKGYKGENAMYGAATIYINLRDIHSRDKIIEALAHEALHITTIKVDKEYYKRLLRGHFEKNQN